MFNQPGGEKILLKFKAYAKETDDPPIDIECDGVTVDGDLLRLESGSRSSDWGFLNRANIAAVVPESNQWTAPYGGESRTFNLYLRCRKSAVPVEAQAIQFSADKIEFCVVQTNLGSHGGSLVQRFPLPHFYVDMSEVVAVLPKDGLADLSRIPLDG